MAAAGGGRRATMMATRWLVRAVDVVHLDSPLPLHDWSLEHLTSTDAVFDVGGALGAHSAVAAARCRRLYDFQLAAELKAAGFVSARPVMMPVVYDSPWAGAIDAPGGLSSGLHTSLARWKRGVALSPPEESTGAQMLAHPQS